jgi:hypothetical protein
MNWSLSRFRTGDIVEVRGKEEILATLDQHGSMDGMPFMPEMLQYCGQLFRVSAVAHKTCDTVRKTWKGRRIQTTVHLASLRCDGSAHGGCQAECNLFWKDAWLKPVNDEGNGSTRFPANVLKVTFDRCTETQLLANTRLTSSVEEEELGYSCQATKLYEATEPLAWWDLRQYVFDVVTRNHSIGWVMGVLWLASLRWFLAHLPFGYQFIKSFNDWMHQRLTGRASPSLLGQIQRGVLTPSGRLGLRPGEYVRIKSQAEIEQTLDGASKNRGLFFDWEMLPYCDRVFKVRSRVSKIIDESTGKMLTMKQACIMLDGVVCSSQYNPSRLMCPRAIPPYWREVWLERVEGDQRSNGKLDDLKTIAANSENSE